MARKRLRRGRDRKIFARTANRTRLSNVTASNAMRGGLMR